MRLLDIAVFHGSSASVRALVDRCGPRRIVRLWTWPELVNNEWTPGRAEFVQLAGRVVPAENVALCFCTCRLREPRIFEAAVIAGLHVSCLNGASDYDIWYRTWACINMLDFAVFFGERTIVDLLRHHGMESAFISNPEWQAFAGMYVVELSEQGMLTLRMPSIRAALDAGINLDRLAMDFEWIIGPYCDQCVQCWKAHHMHCLLKRESGDDIGTTIFLLDAARLLGGGDKERL